MPSNRLIKAFMLYVFDGQVHAVFVPEVRRFCVLLKAGFMQLPDS